MGPGSKPVTDRMLGEAEVERQARCRHQRRGVDGALYPSRPRRSDQRAMPGVVDPPNFSGRLTPSHARPPARASRPIARVRARRNRSGHLERPRPAAAISAAAVRWRHRLRTWTLRASRSWSRRSTQRPAGTDDQDEQLGGLRVRSPRVFAPRVAAIGRAAATSSRVPRTAGTGATRLSRLGELPSQVAHTARCTTGTTRVCEKLTRRKSLSAVCLCSEATRTMRNIPRRNAQRRLGGLGPST